MIDSKYDLQTEAKNLIFSLYAISENTVELGLPAAGFQVNDDKGQWAALLLRNLNPDKTADGIFDNGDVPIGKSGEIYIDGFHRVWIGSGNTLRKDQAVASPVIGGNGDLVAIKIANATGFPPNSTGRVIVYPQNGLNIDKDSVKYKTNNSGEIINFTGLPLKGPFSPAQPPMIKIGLPPLGANKKEANFDVSSFCFYRDTGAYYPSAGSVAFIFYVAGKSGRNQITSDQWVNYGNFLVEVVDSNPDHPRGKFVITTADDPSKNSGGHSYRLNIGEGTWAQGSSGDPGHGNIRAVGVFADQYVNTPIYRCKIWAVSNLPNALTTGAAITFADYNGVARPIYSDGRNWKWI